MFKYSKHLLPGSLGSTTWFSTPHNAYFC